MVTDILQPTHLLFILVVALLVLGPKRLPEVARTLGNGLRDFRSAISGDHADEHPVEPDHYLVGDEHEPDAPAGDAPTTASEAPAGAARGHTSAQRPTSTPPAEPPNPPTQEQPASDPAPAPAHDPSGHPPA